MCARRERRREACWASPFAPVALAAALKRKGMLPRFLSPKAGRPRAHLEKAEGTRNGSLGLENLLFHRERNERVGGPEESKTDGGERRLGFWP